METQLLQDLKVDFIFSPVISFSMQQNHIPVIRKLLINNLSGPDIENITLSLVPEPGFATQSSINIFLLKSGESFEIENFDLKLSPKFLSELTERISGTLKIILQNDSHILYQNDYLVDVLAFDQWQGISILPETIASFITPNNPYISKIISRASEILNTWTGNPALDEYQSRNPDRVKKQMAAVFESIRELDIVYCPPPASFEETGQRIRMIDTIVNQKLGTCLDSSLIYASCLEAIGINPIIVVIKGHAFPGGWLIDDSFPDSINDDYTLLSKRIVEGINEIILVEATFMNSGNTNSFDDAVKAANYHLAKSEDFILFADVKRSRFAGIRPLPQRIKTDLGWEFAEDQKTMSIINAPDEILTEKLTINQNEKEFTKQQFWERKLLDLSLRNNLLNARITKSTIQLISVGLNKLEDALAAGEEFQILPKPGDWDNPLRMAGVYQALNQTDPIIDLVKNELSQKRLRTYLSETDLVHGMTNLYRSSKLSLEENGANTLYLCLGLLKWYETPVSEQPRFSPILLLPVDIIRKSALKGFVIRGREEETLMNITLLEMLRQDFKIIIPGLDPLPKDESGVDVKSIFNIIRQVIMVQEKWDIVEQAILGTFSFNKFIMWNDIHNNSQQLIQNKIVSSLITGKAQWDVDLNQLSSDELDKKYHPSEVILPISADSSQLEAICAANQNKSFILHGPPGTGKSQTITNIIANALYSGKKVLFAAEKMAALSVVQRRLEAIGLSPFCIELHSKKSKKSALLEQLKKTTEIIRKTSSEDFKSEAERINLVRKELNDYVEALHKKYNFGYSLFESFSGYASYKEFPCNFKLEKSVISSLSKEKVRSWTELAEEMKAAGRMCGQIHNHPLNEINTLTYSTETRVNAFNLLDKYNEAIKAFRNSLHETTRILGINVPIKQRSQALSISEICDLLVSAPDISSNLISTNNLDDSLNLIIKISQNGINRNKCRDSLLKTFIKEVLELEAESIKAEWQLSKTKWFIPKFFEQYKIVKTFRNLSLNKKFDKIKLESILETIIEYKKEQSQINSQSSFIAPILGLRWQGGDGDWIEIENVCRTILKLNHLLLSCTSDLVKTAEARQALSLNLREGYKAFLVIHKSILQTQKDNLNNILEIEKKLGSLLSIDFNSIPPLDEIFVENLSQYCNLWKTNIDSLRDWVGWNQTKNKSINEGLEQLVIHLENGNIAVEEVDNFFMKNLFQSFSEYIIEQDPQLSAFNGKLFEEKIRKFRQFSKNFEKLTKDELFARLASRVPSFTQEAAQSSEIGILQRNIRNGGRGTSIRKLFDTIPTLITRICPCMLMSPISVAQYIDINNFKFDLIIFDEASQMPTSEAVSAIARGSNLIVVGDPKQMPPTNFFSTNNIDEENIEKEDMESILDDCLTLSLPSKHLLWHYRSKHESLISFSNSQFYDNSLLTFPSPDDLVTKVKFIHIPGFYDRGKSRQNSFEAKAVISEITRRLSDPELSKKSIGVVTFSSTQQILIDDMLTEAFKKRPDLEIIATESFEPIFIKNLENVQGDERDVILFSVGYGPDKDNKVSLNFGPINREGGWRRLNVAVSRARYEMMVFSTLKAEQIDITRTASKGVAGLKAFLEFAEMGKIALPIHKTNGSFQDMGLTVQLANSLRQDGFNVITNIGSSGFKIDLGITNPKVPSEYVLGVLCDGKNYKELKTAKDREIIQTEVLLLLGWKIHKIWSCDWWDDKDKVLREIKQAIQNANVQPVSQLVSEQQNDANKDVLDSTPEEVLISNNLPKESKYREPYIIYELPIHSFEPPSDLLNLPGFKNSVGNDIQAILEREAPISKVLLCRKILASWSVSRLGSRIDAYFNSLFKQMNLKFTDGGRRFYWKESQVPESYNKYRISEIESQRREASDISPEEASNAVHEILENMISLDKTDLIREAARLFGYSRIGGNVESTMNEGIKTAMQRGFATTEGDRVFLKE